MVTDSPIGPLLIAATDRGLVRVAFEGEGFASVIEDLQSALGVEAVENADALAVVAAQIDEYFGGGRQDFDLELDHALSTGFQREVHEHLVEVPFGQTETYQEVAEAVGNPKAVRAVGTACGANPIPIVVPCHRVLRTDGSLGGYRGGLSVKTVLLELEQAA